MDALEQAKAKLRGLNAKPTVEEAKQALRSKPFDIKHLDPVNEAIALFSLARRLKKL